MNINFTCSQVETLISYYIEGKLAPSLVRFVSEHLKNCSKCKKKFEQMQNVLTEYNKPKTQREPDKELIGSLSAYMDNELDTSENVKIKKMTISNPSARQKLESMYKYQKLIHNAYEKTKNDIKFDYSKNIMAIINKTPDYSTLYFRNIVIVLVLMTIAIISCFIYLYF